jgi:hypothetical protein
VKTARNWKDIEIEMAMVVTFPAAASVWFYSTQLRIFCRRIGWL